MLSVGSCQVDRDLLGDLILFTIEEVAERLQVSERWLAGECRAERIEHVHVARQRRFTRDQVEKLIASRTVRPAADVQMDATRRRVLRMLARR